MPLRTSETVTNHGNRWSGTVIVARELNGPFLINRDGEEGKLVVIVIDDKQDILKLDLYELYPVFDCLHRVI